MLYSIYGYSSYTSMARYKLCSMDYDGSYYGTVGLINIATKTPALVNPLNYFWFALELFLHFSYTCKSRSGKMITEWQRPCNGCMLFHG